LKIYVGTSGFGYPQWKGRFYPEKTKAEAMLAFYATRFEAVEINNTFYRMPKRSLLESWCAEVPASFRFALKASQRITHQHRLRPEAADSVRYFFETASAMGDRLGPTLVQLPPNMKADVPRLEAFLASLPEGARTAFEFRHESWIDDAVVAALSARGAALCAADADDAPGGFARIVPTARFGYLRLRSSGYEERDLAAWAARIREQPWDEAYVFFKHEDEGKGPELATALLGLLT